MSKLVNKLIYCLLFSDVYGAVGDPPLLTRVIVVGKRKKLIENLLTVLSYFIRCSTVREQTPSRPPIDSLPKTNLEKNNSSSLYPDLSEFCQSNSENCKEKPPNNGSKEPEALTTGLYPDKKDLMKNFLCPYTPDTIENRHKLVETVPVGRLSDRHSPENELEIFDEYFDGSPECDLANVSIRPHSWSENEARRRYAKERPPSVASITDHLEEISLPSKQLYSQSTEAGIASNLFANYNERYMSDFVLQGTSECDFQRRMFDDLFAYVKENILEEPVSEACCIVADTDCFTLKVHTCLSSESDRIRSQEISTPSTLVSDLLTSVLHLYKLKMSSEFCVMHVEDCLQQIYFKSKIFAQVVKCCNGRQLTVTELSKQVDVDESDIPLLVRVASTHTSV